MSFWLRWKTFQLYIQCCSATCWLNLVFDIWIDFSGHRQKVCFMIGFHFSHSLKRLVSIFRLCVWSLISPYSAQIWCWMPSCQEHIRNKGMLCHLLEMNIFYLPRAEFKKTLKMKGKEMQYVSSFCQKNNSETQIVSVVCMAPMWLHACLTMLGHAPNETTDGVIPPRPEPGHHRAPQQCWVEELDCLHNLCRVQLSCCSWFQHECKFFKHLFWKIKQNKALCIIGFTFKNIFPVYGESDRSVPLCQTLSGTFCINWKKNPHNIPDVLLVSLFT